VPGSQPILKEIIVSAKVVKPTLFYIQVDFYFPFSQSNPFLLLPNAVGFFKGTALCDKQISVGSEPAKLLL